MKDFGWTLTAGSLRRVTLEQPPYAGRGPDTAEYRPEFVGICGTDLDILAGARTDAARILGHEAVIRRSLDRDQGQVGPGGLYVVNPVNPMAQDEIVGHSTPGMLRTLVNFPIDWGPDRLISVWAAVPVHLAALAEPIGVALYALECLTAGRGEGRRILVIGAGAIGTAIATTAQLVSGARIGIVDVSDRRISRALELGQAHDGVVVLTPEALSAAIRDFAPDAVAVCVPRSARLVTLETVCGHSPPSTVIDLVTGYESEDAVRMVPGLSPHQLRRQNVCGTSPNAVVQAFMAADGRPLFLTGHRGTGARHIERALTLMAAHPDAFERLVTDIVPFVDLRDVIEGLLVARQEPSHAPYRKVVVSMGLQANW